MGGGGGGGGNQNENFKNLVQKRFNIWYEASSEHLPSL